MPNKKFIKLMKKLKKWIKNNRILNKSRICTKHKSVFLYKRNKIKFNYFKIIQNYIKNKMININNKI